MNYLWEELIVVISGLIGGSLIFLLINSLFSPLMEQRLGLPMKNIDFGTLVGYNLLIGLLFIVITVIGTAFGTLYTIRTSPSELIRKAT